MQFFKDGICGGGPHEGLAGGVVWGSCVWGDKVVNALHELFDADQTSLTAL